MGTDAPPSTDHPAYTGPAADLSRYAPRTARPAAVSFAISLGVHAVIALSAILVVWTVTAAPRTDKPDITVSFFDPSPSGVVLTEPAEAPLSATIPLSAPLPQAVADATPAPTLSERVAQTSPGPAAAPTAAATNAPPGESRRQLIESSTFPEVRFAGLGAGNAQSIIYVVDAGGSMVTSFPRVKDDLKRSLFKLSPTQQVQVVFFTKGGRIAAPHPADANDAVKPIRMIRATRENIRAIAKWIDAVSPAGTGNPIPALETALALKPDAVFVLSSVIPGMGEWKPDRAQILGRLEELNPRAADGRRPVVIKTIQYLDADPQGILQAIAEAHGGKDGYNFIKRTDPAP